MVLVGKGALRMLRLRVGKLVSWMGRTVGDMSVLHFEYVNGVPGKEKEDRRR